MSTKQKIYQVREAMNRMLGNFISVGNVQIPTCFKLDNKEPNGAFNVIPVDSKEQAEEISMAIVNNKNIIDEVEDYSKPLYLTVVVSLPR